MKLRNRILGFLSLAPAFGLAGCSGPSGYTYQNVSVQLSFNPICSGVCLNANVFTPVPAPTTPGDLVGPTGAIEMPVGGGSGSCIELTATVSNAPANVTWTIVPTPLATAPTPPTATGTAVPTPATPNTGSLAYTTGLTNYYCMPNGIPIYSGVQLLQAQAAGLQQGETEVVVSVPADPNDPSKVVTQTQTFTSQVGSPPAGILVGITPANTVTVALGASYQFTGYIVGNNGYYTPAGSTTQIPAQSEYWMVNGVHGGSTTTGTITDSGLYTAPKAKPTGTVTVSMASTAYKQITTGGTGQGASTVVILQ